ncbi:hypothetical protein F441_12252 [Phytophthora nicotianae CJ01A1]|uniref:FAR1 domain-containing protein n=1 Tax=Phytophthora nicotianae CJ01A1 TaxID=1317063 RepID=W2WP59_PHYNI|nr:hypothetical protein F441_12252 [Phytophthora nicotianae CJ01A1]
MSDSDDRSVSNGHDKRRPLVRKACNSSDSGLGSDSFDSEAGSVSETAPSFQRWHDTWDDFFKNLRQYEAQTSQLYRIRTCTRVSTRNDKIRKKKKWREGGLVPECFGDYYKKLLCMHGWVSRCPTTNSWRICVTTHNRTHNHRLRKEVYANYPSTRRVMDPDVLDFVDELIKAGAKPKRILKYLQETTDKRVILRDVHNLVQRLKTKRRGQPPLKKDWRRC